MPDPLSPVRTILSSRFSRDSISPASRRGISTPPMSAGIDAEVPLLYLSMASSVRRRMSDSPAAASELPLQGCPCWPSRPPCSRTARAISSMSRSISPSQDFMSVSPSQDNLPATSARLVPTRTGNISPSSRLSNIPPSSAMVGPRSRYAGLTTATMCDDLASASLTLSGIASPTDMQVSSRHTCRPLLRRPHSIRDAAPLPSLCAYDTNTS